MGITPLLPPGLEISLRGVVIQADPLQFRLHAASGLEEPFPLTETRGLGRFIAERIRMSHIVWGSASGGSEALACPQGIATGIEHGNYEH